MLKDACQVRYVGADSEDERLTFVIIALPVFSRVADNTLLTLSRRLGLLGARNEFWPTIYAKVRVRPFALGHDLVAVQCRYSLLRPRFTTVPVSHR